MGAGKREFLCTLLHVTAKQISVCGVLAVFQFSSGLPLGNFLLCRVASCICTSEASTLWQASLSPLRLWLSQFSRKFPNKVSPLSQKHSLFLWWPPQFFKNLDQLCNGSPFTFLSTFFVDFPSALGLVATFSLCSFCIPWHHLYPL
jgi:hypothetical protein